MSELDVQPRAISALVVSLTAEYTGRGPNRAHTVCANNVITVVLEDTLTRGEQVLVRDGEVDTVISMRRKYQRAMKDKLIDGIESITGRTVRAFLSDHHVHPDIAVETFILEPAEAEPAAPPP